jgi:eukaryotic-like serine/threonine-protein kinase
MDHELKASLRVGEVLANKYRVERVLGVGGMGVVVAAKHLQLDQMVALKFLRHDAMRDPKIVSRFEQEARAAARLKSAHVARILDVGLLETGSPYIVMECLEGQDLSAVLRERGALEVSRACDFVIQACDAIAEAHGLGIVHRDLKPGNLFLAETSHGEQIVKVLDFGISKSHGSADDLNMTCTQDVMGSPRYMSPEQMRSAKNVDGRTDIWSLGVILYQLVAGQVPFQAETLSALCFKVAMDPVPPLPAVAVAIPPELDRVIRRALEKDPARRYSSAGELAYALAPFASAECRDRACRLMALTTKAAARPDALPMIDTGVTLQAAVGEVQARMATQGRSRKLLFACLGIGLVSVAVSIALSARPGGEAGGAAAPVTVRARPDTPPTEVVATPPGTAVTASAPEPVHSEAPVTFSAPRPLLIDAGVESQDALIQPSDPVKPMNPVKPSKPRNGEPGRTPARATPAPAAVDPFGSPD